MNNNGKSSIVFLALIPLFFVITLIIVDTLFSYIENKRFKTITESIISEVMNDNELNYEEYSEEIKKRYERHGYDTDMLIVDANRYNVYVENEHAYFGIFSSFSNKKSIESEISILGTTFKVRKNSVARIKVTASFNYEEELEFEYTK